MSFQHQTYSFVSSFLPTNPISTSPYENISKTSPHSTSITCLQSSSGSNKSLSQPKVSSQPVSVPIRKPMSLPKTLSKSELAQRKTELQIAQSQWIYESPKNIPNISFVRGPVDKLPNQMPRFWWVAIVSWTQALVEINLSQYSPKVIFRSIKLLVDSLLADNTNSETLQKIASEHNHQTKEIIAATEERFASNLNLANLGDSTFEESSHVLKPYRDIYTILKHPPIADHFLRDDVFSRLRTAGYNPMSIYQVRSINDLPFTITDSDLLNNDTIQTAITEQRLYAHDFSFLREIEQQRNSEKIVVIANAIYYIPSPGAKLTTIAIEVDGDIVRPPTTMSRTDLEDGSVSRWNIAKMALNVADSVHHEIVAHLGRTHLLVQPFVMATHRQLSTQHPLFMLLNPHFEGTVFINDSAANNLVSPGGDVDNLFAGEIESVMKWCSNIVLNNKFNACMPDVDVKARGIDNNMINMPYVEDALSHWEALLEWVGSYIRHYYEDDMAMLEDDELQAWIEELISPDGGKLKGFGDNEDGQIRTLDYLIRVVSFVIFSASVQHAAVNFPQKSLMSYAPSVAGALWKPPPSSDDNCDPKWWQQSLAPLKLAIEQVRVMEALGSIYYTQIGKYRRNELPKDPVIQAALKQYQKKLKQIDAMINEREKNEILKYDYLRPKNVPQSVNI